MTPNTQENVGPLRAQRCRKAASSTDAQPAATEARSDQVVKELCAYASSSLRPGHGRTAMEIGVELLSRVGSLTTPNEIVASTLKALRRPEGGECKPELLLAAFGAMALTQEMPENSRAELVGLVETCFVAIDEQAAG